jgi:hypothetical protein
LDPEIGYYSVNEVSLEYLGYKNKDGTNFRNVTRRPLDYDLCGDTLLNYHDQDAVKMFGLDKFYCLRNKDYQLEGDFYSSVFRYVEIRLFKCNGNMTCKDQKTIDNFFNFKNFQFGYVNSIFDFTDYENPIH